MFQRLLPRSRSTRRSGKSTRKGWNQTPSKSSQKSYPMKHGLMMCNNGQKSTMENYSVLSCKSKLWTSIILANIKMRRRILTGRVTLFRLFFIAKCPSDSKFTSLKGNVSPQRLRDNRHQVWICVEGEKNDCRVVSSWCTCTAGTGEACNHVIALLYKVNYACNKEYISPACTRIPQGWNKGTKKEVTPNKLKHLTFRKDKKTKKA